MGPQRFPVSIQDPETNVTLPVNDMKLTFQIADYMNQLNAGKPNFTVTFIPWIQNNPNGLYYFNGIKKSNGLPPTITEIKTNPNLTAQLPTDPVVANVTEQIQEIGCNSKITAAAARNVFTAHKAWLDSGLGGAGGGDDWSEFAYVHNYLKYSLNVTDQAVIGGALGASAGDTFWDAM